MRFSGSSTLHFFTVTQHIHIADIRHVIGARCLFRTVETECIASYFDGVADFHAHIFFGFITAHQRDANNEHRYAQVGGMHAVIAA